METDDEGGTRLSQSIGSALGGVHVVVIDTNGDTLDTPAAEAGSTAVWKNIKDLWVRLKEQGGKDDAGQKLFMEWYTTMTQSKQVAR